MHSLRYYVDSWIEVSSQPSSSSLSSAANDDIVTTGLRVDRRGSSSAYHHNRRRHLRNLSAATAPHINYSPREPSSSQDEYEESESESDRVLSSSNEDITTRSRGDALLLRTRSAFNSSEAAPSSDDDDDNSTALGMQINTAPFVPQPNAFSHPPASQTQPRARVPEHSRSNSNLSNASRRTAIRNNSYPSARSSRRQQHSPYNMISPSYQADQDAALRASLSTLLSCAAAARGLPKNDTQPAATGPPAQPSSFRLVSESVAMGEESGEEEPRRALPAATSPSPAPNRLANQNRPSTSNSANAVPPASKPKRRASSSKDRASSRPSTSKKTRRSGLADSVVSAVSPTVMTWVISAGVVVLFSAISFSAGYALGREVGRTEAAGGMVGDGAFSSATTSAGCGKEAVKGGLKRLRWGAAAASSSVSV